MSHQKYLVLGRAGSGKTRLLLGQIIDHLKHHKEEKLLFLLPTYSQVEHIKHLILRSGAVNGFFESTILTFSGLARRILKPVRNRIITKSQKRLILTIILNRLKNTWLKDATPKKDLPGLNCKPTETFEPHFLPIYDYPGFRNLLIRLIREIKENNSSPQDFFLLARAVFQRPGHASALKRCEEIAAIYEYYQNILEQNSLMDEEDLIALALNQIQHDKTILSGVELLLIDGFHEYTQIEFSIISELIKSIPMVYITLTYLPDMEDASFLKPSAETYKKFSVFNLQEIRLIRNLRTTDQALSHIEDKLFSNSPNLQFTASGLDPATRSYITESIKITEAANISDEIEQIARRIKLITFHGDYRFSDICIIIRDIKKYQDLIESTFSKLYIPVRIYMKKPLFDHPIIRAILNLNMIMAGDWDDQKVMKALKSPFFGIDQKIVDKLEYKLSATGMINGPDEWLNLVSSTSEWQPVQEFLKKIRHATATLATIDVHGYKRIISQFLKTSLIADISLYSADIEFYNQQSSCLMAFYNILDSIAQLADSSPQDPLSSNLNPSPIISQFGLKDFFRIMEGELKMASFGWLDKRRDVVNVIDAFEARQWEVPVVFVAGLLEKEFPRYTSKDLFLKETERSLLNASGRIFLREQSTLMDEERYLFYINLTRAKERLYLSYPGADNNGAKTLPSFFLDEVQRLFTTDHLKGIYEQRNLSQIIPAPSAIWNQRDLKDFIYFHFHDPIRDNLKLKAEGSKQEAEASRSKTLLSDPGSLIPDPFHVNDVAEKSLAIWLYNNIKRGKPFRITLREAANQASRDSFAIARIFDSQTRQAMQNARVYCQTVGDPAQHFFSFTEISEFVQCPFRHFAGHILRLRKPSDKVDDGLNNRIQGKIIHAVLESFYKERGRRDISNIFEEEFDKETHGIPKGLDELKIKAQMLNVIQSFPEMEEKYDLMYGCKPSMYEVEFSPLENKSSHYNPGQRIHRQDRERIRLGPLTIYDNRIGFIRLAGKIDRIDIGEHNGRKVGIVIDYKYSKAAFNNRNIEEIKEGIDLQLPIYLMVIKELLAIDPVAGEYYFLKTGERNGIMDENFVNNGILPSKKDKECIMVDTKGLEILLSDCKGYIIKYAGDILTGKIDINPRDLERCGEANCDYADICRADKWMFKK